MQTTMYQTRQIVTPLTNAELIQVTEDMAAVLRVTDVPAERLALVGAARAAFRELTIRTIDLERMVQLERATGFAPNAFTGRQQAE